MANPRNLKFIRPDLADVLTTPERRAAFDDSSAAIEAGQLVRTLRKQAGLSQSQLADLLGVSQPRVSAIEAGDGRDGPSYALLKRIAIACGASWNLSTLIVKPAPFEEEVLADEAAAMYAAAAAVRRRRRLRHPLLDEDENYFEEPAETEAVETIAPVRGILTSER